LGPQYISGGRYIYTHKYGAIAELQLGRDNLRNLDKHLLHGHSVHHQLEQTLAPWPATLSTTNFK